MTAATLTVYSDYVCPFCYLGYRSLQQYETASGTPVDREWHPFDLRRHRRRPDGSLDPGLDGGKDEAYFKRARANVRRLQDRYGVEMARDLATDVDSLPAQLVSVRVEDGHPDRWRSFDEAIFEALWVERRDIGDRAVLADLARAVGLDGDIVADALDDAGLRERVFDTFDAAARRGVTGVPTFVADGRVARGAVPPDHLGRIVDGNR